MDNPYFVISYEGEKMMLFRTACLCVIIFFILMASPVFAEDAQRVSVEVNGQLLSFDQADYMLAGGRILVPSQHIFAELEAKYSWNEKTQTITVAKGNRTIALALGKSTAVINGKTVKVEQPARIVHDRTMVPLRLVSEALGAKVGWDQETRTAFVDTLEKKLGIMEKGMLALAAQGKVKGFEFALGTLRTEIETKCGKPVESFYYEGGEFFTYAACDCIIYYDESNAASIFWLGRERIGNVKTADVRKILGKPRWEEESQTHIIYLLYYPAGKNSIMFRSSSKNGTINGLWLSDRLWE
jgi:hypothetical protein